jgi:cellulose synthase/poly-beta-1,6-N-acetylglucosamine synthase-like glycosyltransferase
MLIIEVLVGLLAVTGIVLSSYVLLLPIIAFATRSRVDSTTSLTCRTVPTIAVIIPAHNMKDVVARCILSLHKSDYPTEKISIFVAADHCSDSTANVAIEAGAAVLVRDHGMPGKTYTIAWTLNELESRCVAADLYVIVDATARVHSKFLGALSEKWRSGRCIVIGHAIVDAENQQWFAKCLGLTLSHRSLQNWSRERLGLSCFIGGRGMAYSREYIARFGWSLALPTNSASGDHPTEDWRHGVRVVEHGMRASFADDALVFTPLRGSLEAATKQGIRWERGRILNAASLAPALLLTGLQERSGVKCLAAIDAMQPPVAVMAGLSAVTACVSILMPLPSWLQVLALLPIALIAAYAVIVLLRGRTEGIPLRTIAWAPVYVAWRCAAFISAWGILRRSNGDSRD